MSVHELSSYQSLLLDPRPHPNRPVRWLSQSHGEVPNRALAFQGSEAYIALCHNLFINYDDRPAAGWKGHPYVNLKRDYDVAYINVTPNRLYSTLFAYFRANISHRGELKGVWGGDRSYKAALGNLASRAANAFIENEIELCTFLRDDHAGINMQHSWNNQLVAAWD